MSEYPNGEVATLQVRLPIRTVNKLYDKAIANDQRVARILLGLITEYLTESAGADGNEGSTTPKKKRKSETK